MQDKKCSREGDHGCGFREQISTMPCQQSAMRCPPAITYEHFPTEIGVTPLVDPRWETSVIVRISAETFHSTFRARNRGRG